MIIDPRPEVAAMSPYTPGMSLSEARRDSGRQQMIKLASNESLWGPSPHALDAARQALDSISYYPMVQEPEFIQALAGRHGFSADQLIVGNGADEILRVVAAAYVRCGDEVIYPTPSFSAYRHSALLAGARPVAVDLASNGANDLDAMLRAVTPRTRLVYLCSPNNPTGTAITPEDWTRYLSAVPASVLTVVDAAYDEFCQGERPAFAAAVRSGRPVVWVRTFSKLYGLAALRVGWAAAPAQVIRNLLRVREPFSVNSIGWAAAQASLEDETYFSRVLQETLEARQFLAGQLDAMGLRRYRSEANFMTFAVPVADADVARQLRQNGFVVRPTSSFGLAGHIRVTVAPVPVVQAFLSALAAVLNQGMK